MAKQKNILITGTDTDIGKTIFAAGLTAALNASYWKPIQAGLAGDTDSDIVAELSGRPILPEAYRLKTPASPHYAAEQDGVEIEFDELNIPRLTQGGYLVIEAAGGLMVPLKRPMDGNEGVLMLDLFANWAVPTILCARTALGTINHTLLSIKALQDAAIPILGIVFIGDENIDSQATIIEFAGVPNLGRLALIKLLNRKNLSEAMNEIHLDLIRYDGW